MFIVLRGTTFRSLKPALIKKSKKEPAREELSKKEAAKSGWFPFDFPNPCDWCDRHDGHKEAIVMILKTMTSNRKCPSYNNKVSPVMHLEKELLFALLNQLLDLVDQK